MSRPSQPNAREPWLDPRTGMVSRYWLRFLNDVFNELGGSLEPSSVAAETLTATASPFIYTAEENGLLIIRGGMIEKIEYGRRGEFFSDGSTAGMYQIVKGDQIRVTYSTAPSITFIRT